MLFSFLVGAEAEVEVFFVALLCAIFLSGSLARANFIF